MDWSHHDSRLYRGTGSDVHTYNRHLAKETENCDTLSRRRPFCYDIQQPLDGTKSKQDIQIYSIYTEKTMYKQRVSKNARPHPSHAALGLSLRFVNPGTSLVSGSFGLVLGLAL